MQSEADYICVRTKKLNVLEIRPQMKQVWKAIKD